MEQCLLTLIIPYFNEEKSIDSCLNQLINQSEQNFKVILINDGSKDSSPVIVESKLRELGIQRTDHITLKYNNGVAHARNIGLSLCDTPYLLFMDADDYLAPCALKNYYALMNKQKTVVSPIEDYKFVNDQITHKEKEVTYDQRSDINQFLVNESVCNILFRRDIIQKYHIRFDEDLKVYSDLPFLVKYLKHIDEYIYLMNNGYYVRGEISDPFNKDRLYNYGFDDIFCDYINSYTKVMDLNIPSKWRALFKDRIVDFLIKNLDSSNEDIKSKYFKYNKSLSRISRKIFGSIIKSKKPLFILEMFLLGFVNSKLAYKVNRLREVLKHLRNILLNKSTKNYSSYILKDRESKVEPGTIIFESFGGKDYSDSPKCLYEYMQTHYPQYQYIWCFKEPQNYKIPGNAIKVKKGSPEYYKAYSKASHWVSNARIEATLNKKINQKYYQIWHGTPLKRLAGDMEDVHMPNTTTDRYKKNFKKETERWDYLVSPNHYSTEIFKTAFWMDEKRIIETGYPRNDILVNEANNKDLKLNIKENLHIPTNKKVILYAPTWRDDEYDVEGAYQFNLKIDLEKLRQKLGDDYIILLRMHYLIANQLDLSEYGGFAFDVSSHNDISELYLISDLLITDYSSVMFDFGILKRPQLFYAYDIERYDDKLRGFYMNYHTDLPGPIVQDTDTLLSKLMNIDQVEDDYKNKIEAFYNKFCSLEDGNASSKIAEKIVEEIENMK
ncbi:bifunctional glycosyltransferase/CDP-glycerol:glycerophosphate glycerophosphotransferase [Staphylococcus pettenkoferi]|uniref:bifunctional glycosyltransferase/CDP-glycerol:glycerophosphate glycerophosphotransferase n=1 Tax=Staphylococcus pettenkoferi TaxID=170573 RepID=UPI002273FE48|nr:bifunctional glycosyltransferase family 2 protein/CDP-glycerol:glycerophosphate glycerophosphotransferase [Staphylococcus pettenkoferi]MCY1590439.1 bifunctional glycosyltransferase family 2 protein/CDP-glycerol:glycerophosphate glycerophosphotransferase [Staphylococcus pettenkoferi]MCY1600092.1 bifunctional glycosyltransferase family 2 protein/CDP-glycerol:glycerophosphate glycerophosphotransferase [Staphylococcus pettenkoferi]MCY1614347.1 bifunctional glycosyltransferase family 2 protein/CDP